MKIRVDYTNSGVPELPVKIESAKYLADYAIRIKFSDGVENLVDFKPFLKKSNHPTVKKYLDEETFSGFSLTDGNLNWNDYDLIFPLAELYKGQVRF